MIRFFGLGAIALLSPLFSQAASLYLAAPQTPLSVGDSFVIEVRADTQGESVSAAEAEIAFTPGCFSYGASTPVLLSLVRGLRSHSFQTRTEDLSLRGGWIRRELVRKFCC